MEFLCYIVSFVLLFFYFFCIVFVQEIRNYINACAEAKRKQQERLKWFDDWLKKELKEEYYDNLEKCN